MGTNAPFFGRNPVSTLRAEILPERLGRSISQLDLALLFGVSPKRISSIERLPAAQVPPAFYYACLWVERAGWDAAEACGEPEPEEIDELVGRIHLTHEQIATLLGKRRQSLYSLRTGHKQETIKLYYLFALRQLALEYGITRHEYEILLSRFDRGARYLERKRAKRAA